MIKFLTMIKSCFLARARTQERQVFTMFSKFTLPGLKPRQAHVEGEKHFFVACE